MHPRDCQWWDYERHALAGAVALRCEKLLNDLEHRRFDIDRALRDTRPHHSELFVNLTPPEQPYLAGNYRGSRGRCLRFLDVKVDDGDPRVGTPAARVDAAMANFSSNLLLKGLRTLDEAFKIPDSELSPAEKLNYVVKFACRLLVQFLAIHPYANGNGHIGRLIIWLITARFDYWPKDWPLDERPPYVDLIKRYRDGDEQALEEFVHKTIAGSVVVPPAVDVSSGSNATAVRAT